MSNGLFTVAGLVENMAQSAAAGMGQQAGEAEKEGTIGYIGALTNLWISELPAAGSTLITEVEIKHRIMSAQIAHARVLLDGTEVAKVEMKIFLQK